MTQQDELLTIRDKMQAEAPPTLPPEDALRTRLMYALGQIEECENIERQRVLFGMLLESVALTLIVGQARGETIKVTLREEGCPDFWRLIQAP